MIFKQNIRYQDFTGPLGLSSESLIHDRRKVSVFKHGNFPSINIVMQKGERMDKVELMVVEDTFMIESIGLVLAPSFELPSNGKWKNINEVVSIRTKDGREISAKALFSVAHLNIRNPTVSVSKRWPILVSLNGVSKESVPAGSIVYVSKSTKQAITGQNA